MPESLIAEDDEKRIYACEGGTPDRAGHYTGTRIEWKPGTPEANRVTLEQQALAALAANKAWLAQAKPATAAAQASSAYDQAKALTRQMNGVIRLLTGRLDSTD